MFLLLLIMSLSHYAIALLSKSQQRLKLNNFIRVATRVQAYSSGRDRSPSRRGESGDRSNYIVPKVGSEVKRRENRDQERTPYSTEQEPNSKDPESFGERRESFPKDRGSFSKDREFTPKDRGSFGDRRESFSKDRGSFSERRESFSKDRGSFSKDREFTPKDRGSFGDRRESFSKDRGSFSDRRESFSKERRPFGDRRESSSNDRRSFGDRRDGGGEFKPRSFRDGDRNGGERRFDRSSRPNQAGNREGFNRDREVVKSDEEEGQSDNEEQERPRERSSNFRSYDSPRSFDRDRGQSSFRPQFNNRRYETEEKTEPHYGYYDGDHIYGVNPVRLALKANMRQVAKLLVQSDMDLDNKKDSKSAREILDIAKERGIEIMELSKHDLNMISDNKPHQGFVLRAQPLQFQPITVLEKVEEKQLVLLLDEVWDPQNFGALLRTSYFLGCNKVIVCAKNSAPLSPAVSKASAGAMEVMPVYSVSNVMKFLDTSKENGWQVVGTHLGEQAKGLTEIPLDQPTIVVLGNEGHGIRTNVIHRCDHLLKIDSNIAATESGVEAVDSLNVSVTGGIILHGLLERMK